MIKLKIYLNNCVLSCYKVYRLQNFCKSLPEDDRGDLFQIIQISLHKAAYGLIMAGKIFYLL